MDISHHIVASNRMKLLMSNKKDSARTQRACLTYVRVRQIMIIQRIIVEDDDVLESKRSNKKSVVLSDIDIQDK